MPQQQRVEYIDIAKGMCVLLVMFAHTVMYKWFLCPIYMFHMPMFFMLSGMVFKVDEGWWARIKKSAIHLLVPILFFMVMFLPLRVLRDRLETGEFPEPCLSMLSMDYYDNILWFLPALFGIIVIMRTLLTLVRNRIVVGAVVVGIGAVGYCLMMRGVELPLYITQGLFSLPFFALGMVVRRVDGVRWIYMVGALLFCFGLWGLWMGHVHLDIYALQVDTNPLFVYLPAIGGSLSALWVARLFESGIGDRLRTSLAYLGRNTLYIFACHNAYIGFMCTIYYHVLGLTTHTLVFPFFVLFLWASAVLLSLGIGYVLKRVAPRVFR